MTTVTDSVRDAFITALDLPPATAVETLELGATPEWDSLGHMALVADLEERFEVSFDTDDLVAMNTYAIALEILRRLGVAV